MADQKPAVSVDDVRNLLRDRVPLDNDLHDGLEFSDEEILEAMSYGAEEFNMVPPMIFEPFTVENFPYRMILMQLAAAFLLKARAVQMERNRLSGSTKSGTNVDDKNKMGTFLQLAQVLKEEALQRAKEIKVQANIGMCWGRVDGPWTMGGRI